MTEWFARPVLHVSNVEASLRFYVDRLGFTVPWRVQDEDGRAHIAEVDRQGCALILSDERPEKVGTGLMFVSLNVQPETREAEVAAVDALRAELEARGVQVEDGRWGYRVLVVGDLDGNQLFVPYPNEPQTKPEGLVILDAER
jgi:catechol 2,3-dioxygenase-like lactoylglutathione lyase family enzyme